MRPARSFGIVALAAGALVALSAPFRAVQAEVPDFDAGSAVSVRWDKLPILGARDDLEMTRLGSKILLFSQGETWEFDGTAWLLRTPAHSPPRTRGAFFGTWNGRAILHGGLVRSPGSYWYDRTSYDTWSWDGVDWTRMAFTGLYGISSYSGAIATCGDRLITHLSGTYAGTYEFTGAGWVALSSPTSPPATLSQFAMTGVGNKCVLYGGIDYSSTGSSLVDRTWEWESGTWTERFPTNRPPKLRGHRLAARGSKVLLFGRERGDAPSGTWEWDGTNWSEHTSSPAPSPRGTIGLAGLGDDIFMFGGQLANDRYSDELWKWNDAGWQLLSANTTPYWPSEATPLVALGANAFTFAEPDGVPEVWRFTNERWSKLDSCPNVRVSHAARVGTKIALWGSSVDQQTLGLWEFDGTNCALATTVTGHVTGLASFGSSVLLLVRDDLTGDVQTWSWSGTQLVQHFPATRPKWRNEAAFAERPGKLVMFGGQRETVLDDTWEWDGTNWEEKLPAHRPSARYRHAMDSAGGLVVLTGGTAGFDEVWSWNGTDWTLHPGAKTPVEYQARWATTSEALVLFDGSGRTTWLPRTGGAILGATCASATECASGFCVDSVCCNSDCGGGATTPTCYACSAAKGAQQNGVCSPTNAKPCDDGDPCTLTQECQAGRCVPTSLVKCLALDACHAPGTCSKATGTCSNPTKPDDSPCSGGACVAGVCTAPVPPGDAGASSDASNANDGGEGGIVEAGADASETANDAATEPTTDAAAQGQESPPASGPNETFDASSNGPAAGAAPKAGGGCSIARASERDVGSATGAALLALAALFRRRLPHSRSRR